MKFVFFYSFFLITSSVIVVVVLLKHINSAIVTHSSQDHQRKISSD